MEPILLELPPMTEEEAALAVGWRAVKTAQKLLQGKDPFDNLDRVCALAQDTLKLRGKTK